MIADRHRIVRETDGIEDVESTLLAADEIWPMLDVEELLHTRAGWEVTRYGATLRCTKGSRVRWVWVRSRPVMEDTL